MAFGSGALISAVAIEGAGRARRGRERAPVHASTWAQMTPDLTRDHDREDMSPWTSPTRFGDQMPREDHDGLAAVWSRLEVLLEVHADAGERFFYPALLHLGRGTPDGGVDDEVEDAITDHNDIRDGIRASREHPAGAKDPEQFIDDNS